MDHAYSFRVTFCQFCYDRQCDTVVTTECKGHCTCINDFTDFFANFAECEIIVAVFQCCIAVVACFQVVIAVHVEFRQEACVTDRCRTDGFRAQCAGGETADCAAAFPGNADECNIYLFQVFCIFDYRQVHECRCTAIDICR